MSERPHQPPVVNTHVHVPPNFSAFADVEDVVDAARREGAVALGISNFFDQSVYPRFGEACRAAGITPLFGLEFITLVDDLAARGVRVNDPANPGRMYLCGKGIVAGEVPEGRATDTARTIRTGNDERAAAMVAALSEHLVAAGLPAPITVADVAGRVAADAGVPVEWVSLQERHIARAGADAVLAQGAEEARAILTRAYGGPPRADLDDPTALQGEVRSRLLKAGAPAFAPEVALSFDVARTHVLDRGGIPTYPTLADGADPVCPLEEDPEQLAAELLALGIHAAELIPNRNASKVVDAHVRAFTEAGLIVMAGTEHNTPEQIPVDPRCADGPLSEYARAAFWRATCVVAAHAERVARGLPGFVDADGQPTGLTETLAAEGARLVAPEREARRDGLVAVLAPTLRALAGGADRLAVVSVDRGEAHPGDVALALGPDAPAEDAAAALASALAGRTAQDGAFAVAVPGVGRLGVTLPAGEGRVAGKVVVVTGGAQGFGRGIAEGLLAEGATVVLADLNEDLAAREASGFSERFGAGRASAVRVDVSDEASVRAMVRQVVERFGGIDVFVSNAGVLRAESVLTQPAADFDLVTAVNYRGYFLCTQAVAPVMAAQHAARPDLWFDIVEINSKSGLEGSRANFAYAGSKFGGIGLTQSFALELVSSGIKVNAICPGNFLDGPLWSDPERGLFVQYLRAGKVPGATTIEDVRASYEAKVPMGRGCTPADVTRALLYVVEQAYETGQAVPVTGGQNMLH